jgi:hypothetical protein
MQTQRQTWLASFRFSSRFGFRRWFVRLVCSWACVTAGAHRAATAEPVYPLKVSRNHRYFTDQRSTPVFCLGTTQWELVRGHTVEEARLIIEKSKQHGFVFAQVMLAGVGEGTNANVHGQKAWHNDNVLTPNETYFKHVDDILQVARENNFVISLTVYHQRWRHLITVDNARAWGKWIALRYKRVPNLIWCLIPPAEPAFVPVVRELVAGLQQGDRGYHLVTIHPDPAPHPAGFFHQESWMDFCVLQTWKWADKIYPMVTTEYHLKPIKPVIMGEGAYENGSEYGFEVTPLWVRRQAYYSYLAGAHHAYGHNDSWRMLPTWKQALDAPGAAQMTILRKIFEGQNEWWHLVPDQTIFASGGNTNGNLLNLAARHKDGKWLMAYLAEKTSFAVHLDKLARTKRASVFWFNPKTGESVALGEFATTEVQSFAVPEGWEDALWLAKPAGD